MRFVAGLSLLAPVALVLVFLGNPHLVDAWFPGALRPIAAAIAAAVVGVSLTATLVLAYARLRYVALVRAAEGIAAGEVDVEIRVPRRGLERRLAIALTDAAAALSTTQHAATVDRLTGVSTRASLITALFNEVERAQRYHRALSVAFVDIDHFKAVNDTYGHAAGDVVLRGVAQTIKANLRATDVVGRYGGEEFMLLLTETNVEEGAVLAEKLRMLVQKLRFDVEGNPSLGVTISIGIAGGVGQQLRVDALVRDADAAMYSAKALGRNQTYVFAEPDEEARVPRAPISAAGRARAIEIGRAAGEAATAALTSVIAPLPHYRGQPSALIASIVVAVGRQLDLPDAELDRLRIAALLHDIGKVAVPEEILEKPAPLSSAEWRSVVQHPRVGQVILEQASTLREAVPIILHHHERYSGHGYPYGLRGNDIPLGARIVAIADAYDAMIHDRPYKRAMSHAEAINELRRHAGTQFDPELVNLFCDLYATAPPQPDARVTATVEALAARSAGGAPAAAIAAAGASRGRGTGGRARTGASGTGPGAPRAAAAASPPKRAGGGERRGRPTD